ncbi:MAG: 3-methyl-2-oxobutanoate hydroxymethyltransferase [Exilispira sp.]
MKNFGNFSKKKRQNKPLVLITAYTYSFARIIDQIEDIDAILVGDSVANVEYGYDSTLPITLDQMLNHVSIVSKTCKNKPVIADMPFLSYGASINDSIINCGRMIKEGAANAVKIEGGKEFAELVYKLTTIGIPVMGHIGLKPQHYNLMGGYKIAGKTDDEIEELIDDAIALEQAGSFSLILECVTEEAAKAITNSVSIPTIGIGSSKYCDGQICVLNDLLGLSSYIPSFMEKYVDLAELSKKAIENWAKDVLEGSFPKNSFKKGLN